MTTVARPKFVFALDGDPVTQGYVRVRADNLRMAQRERGRLRADAERAGLDPSSVVVALEVDVVLDARAADARSVAPARAPGVITYIGTPAGLRSLLWDVYAAEVADAVVLRPVGGPRTLALIECELQG